MATIDELTRLEHEIEEAERHALRNLADHLRAAVLDMPAESRLARAFARHAAKFERWAHSGKPATMGKLEFDSMDRDIQADARELVLADIGQALLEGASRLQPGDPLKPTLEREAYVLLEMGA